VAEDHESEIYLVRYRKAIKKHQGLYKALFVKFAGEDEGKRVGRSLALDLQTFEDYGRNNSIISVQGLFRMVQALDLEFQQKTAKALREDIANITKLINLNVLRKTKQQNINELDQDGFAEFLLQIAHLAFNVVADATAVPRKFVMKAF
jgi:hypothetical protein